MYGIASRGLASQFSHSHKKNATQAKGLWHRSQGRESGQDSCVDCERSGMPISIPSAMRAKGYDNDAAKDDSLQQQVRRLAADLKQK